MQSVTMERLSNLLNQLQRIGYKRIHFHFFLRSISVKCCFRNLQDVKMMFMVGHVRQTTVTCQLRPLRKIQERKLATIV